MNEFYGFFICTDIDGTLYHSGRALSERNRAAIEAFTAAGGLLPLRQDVRRVSLPALTAAFCRRPSSPPAVRSSWTTGRAVLSDEPFDADGYDILREIWREYPEVAGILSEDNHTTPQLSAKAASPLTCSLRRLRSLAQGDPADGGRGGPGKA